MTVKKNKFTEFFKGKGYYVLLFVGVLAIAAVAIIGSRLSSEPQEEGEDFVDLNEPDNNIAAEEDNDLQAENNISSGDVANNEDSTAQNNTADQVADNDSLLEYDIYTQEEENGIDLAEAAEPEEKKTAEEEPKAVETAGRTVEADMKTNNLNFNVEKGLLWPVEGNVIMPYSMDHTIYYATLMQFKCNPAIIIDAEVGTEVKAAADGVVTSIEIDEETGLTITTDIGNGFSLVYGQLSQDDNSLKIGSRLKEGDILGTISKPTKYYSVEGSNLYFQVLENNETVNPMLYLR
jgi:murein DD-endopeptidase MepM/ murein hydrolase activator NlpD